MGARDDDRKKIRAGLLMIQGLDLARGPFKEYYSKKLLKRLVPALGHGYHGISDHIIAEWLPPTEEEVTDRFGSDYLHPEISNLV